MARTTDSAARDYDETRRLLYMALTVGRTKRYNLAGTLINALRHHQGVEDPDLEERVLALMDGPEAGTRAAQPSSEDEQWARAQIERLTQAHEGQPALSSGPAASAVP